METEVRGRRDPDFPRRLWIRGYSALILNSATDASASALLGCRRSCFAFVLTIRQPTERTQSADGGLAKPRGVSLTVEGYLHFARYHVYPLRRGKSGSRRPLTSVSTLPQALDRSYFVNWDKLYGYAQTHQKILFSLPYQPTKPATQSKSFCGAFFKKRPYPPFPLPVTPALTPPLSDRHQP